MKTINRVLLSAAAVLAFAGCSDDDPEGPQIVTCTVTFEDASLDAGGILTGKGQAVDVTADGGSYKAFNGTVYTSCGADFGCYYSNEWGSDYCAGFTVSNNTDMQTAGFTNQYSVYAAGGANGSSKFALAYYDSWSASAGNDGAIPTVTFGEKVNPTSVWVNNNTYAYLWWTTGKPDSSAAPAMTDATLTAKGYADGSLVREVTFKLVDAAAKTVVGQWTSFDLTALGWVDKIEFHYACDDYMAPAYFCLDDLSFVTEVTL